DVVHRDPDERPGRPAEEQRWIGEGLTVAGGGVRLVLAAHAAGLWRALFLRDSSAGNQEYGGSDDARAHVFSVLQSQGRRYRTPLRGATKRLRRPRRWAAEMCVSTGACARRCAVRGTSGLAQDQGPEELREPGGRAGVRPSRRTKWRQLEREHAGEEREASAHLGLGRSEDLAGRETAQAPQVGVTRAADGQID